MADISNTPTDTSTVETKRADTPGARLAAKRAAKAARKASQRGTDAPGEEVTKSLLSASDWLDQHKAKLWGTVVGAVLIGGGLIAFSMHRTTQANEAGNLLLGAVTTSEGIITTGDETAPEEPLVPTFESAAQRDAKALAQFHEAATKEPSATAAAWARLGEANMLLSTAKYEQAQRAYAAVLEGAKEDDFLSARALEGAGYVLEAQKKFPEALKRFEELGALAHGAYKTVGDYHRGRVLAATGQRDEAIKVLQSIVKASAAKPAEESERFSTEVAAAQTLLEELGVAPENKPAVDTTMSAGAGGKGEISQQVMDAIRKQLEAQKAGAPK